MVRSWIYKLLTVSRLVGLLLYWACSYIECRESNWRKSASLRNYLPDSDLITRISSSFLACMILCLMTDGCCFISYIATSSECVRHSKMAGYSPKNSSSAWNLMNDDGCPCGWYRVETSCLLFAHVYLSWQESVAYCQRLDAHLAEVNSVTKHQLIQEIARTKTEFQNVWLGGSDIADEGTWAWISGSPVIEDNWADAMPDDYGMHGTNADCICMGVWAGFNWDDCHCYTTLAPLCEIPSG